MAQYYNLKDESAKTAAVRLRAEISRNTPKRYSDYRLCGLDGPERQDICERIAEACKTCGFFHSINHGVHQSLIKRAKDVSTEFFHGPEEEKSESKYIPPYGGWAHSKHMTEGHNLIEKDTAEYLYNIFHPIQQLYIDRVPNHPASYKSTLLEYTKELKFLGEKLCCILSEMLRLEPEAMHTALTAISASQSNISVRINFYELEEDGKVLPGICQAHSDPAGLTIFLADGVPGLEVSKDGRWVKVKPIPDGLIVNIGDLLEICSMAGTRAWSTGECYLIDKKG